MIFTSTKNYLPSVSFQVRYGITQAHKHFTKENSLEKQTFLPSNTENMSMWEVMKKIQAISIPQI